MNYPNTEFKTKYNESGLRELDDLFETSQYSSGPILVKIKRDYLEASGKQFDCPSGYAIGTYSVYAHKALNENGEDFQSRVFDTPFFTIDFKHIDAWDYVSNLELANKRVAQVENIER